jgi:hypothetical protein
MTIGIGCVCSAIIGAPIEKVLPNKLQIPIAVAAKRVGNMSAFTKNTRLKKPDDPNFVNMTKIGIKLTYYASNNIITPPKIEIEICPMNAYFAPNF